MMFDPTSIHNTVKKIKKQSVELNVLSEELKTKCDKEKCNEKFPPNNEMEKPIESEEK